MNLGLGIDLKLEAIEERRVADMKGIEERRAASMKAILDKISIMEERLRSEMRVMQWGIGLLLAVFVGVFSPQISALLFGS